MGRLSGGDSRAKGRNKSRVKELEKQVSALERKKPHSWKPCRDIKKNNLGARFLFLYFVALYSPIGCTGQITL